MPVRCQRLLIRFIVIIVVATNSLLAQAAPAPEVTVGAVTSSQPLRDGMEIQAGVVTLRITALRDDIIRVRMAPGALLEDASWAVLAGPRGKSVDVQATQDDAAVGFRTAASSWWSAIRSGW
jgi:alpha-glucosidase